MKIAPVTTVVQRPFLFPTAVFVMFVLLTILFEIRQISSLFVPTAVGIELDTLRGCQHLRCEVFGIVARNIFSFSKGVVFRKIAVRVRVRWNGHTD